MNLSTTKTIVKKTNKIWIKISNMIRREIDKEPVRERKYLKKKI